MGKNKAIPKQSRSNPEAIPKQSTMSTGRMTNEKFAQIIQMIYTNNGGDLNHDINQWINTGLTTPGLIKALGINTKQPKTTTLQCNATTAKGIQCTKKVSDGCEFCKIHSIVKANTPQAPTCTATCANGKPCGKKGNYAGMCMIHFNKRTNDAAKIEILPSLFDDSDDSDDNQ